jgi:cysteinyl-tRNA synthetase
MNITDIDDKVRHQLQLQQPNIWKTII